MNARPLPDPAPTRAPLAPIAVMFVALALALSLAIINHLRGFVLWRNYSLAGFFIGAAVAYLLWRFDVRVPHYILGAVVASALLHFGGGTLGSPDPYRMGPLGMHGVNGAYHTFSWWDHLTHGVGIGSATMGFAYLLDVYQMRRGLRWNGPALWTVAVLCGLTVGVGMELYEYLGKTAFQTIDQGGYTNTMQDLHFNVYGAVTGATLAIVLNRTAFQRRIRDHWNVDHAEPRPGNWFQRLPPRMAGLLAFTILPTGMSLFLAIQFFFITVPEPDLPLYDNALNLLTASAVAAVAAFPLFLFAQRRWAPATEAA